MGNSQNNVSNKPIKQIIRLCGYDRYLSRGVLNPQWVRLNIQIGQFVITYDDFVIEGTKVGDI